jgi:oligoribonuclease (3'-5' exoribonuclease)
VEDYKLTALNKIIELNTVINDNLIYTAKAIDKLIVVIQEQNGKIEEFNELLWASLTNKGLTEDAE